MGGYGSGRQDGRPIAEEALRIDIAWMVRQGLAVPGNCRTGSLNWTCRGEPSGRISFTCDMRDPDDAHLELRFAVTRHRTGDRKDYVQRIRISYTEPNFGGKRWWMHCPKSGERVGKLYVPAGGDIFASRKAWGIGYRSQRVTPGDKPFEALFRIQRKLGCEEGWGNFIRRPKGMWRKTYARLEQQYWQMDEQCGVHMMAAIGMLDRGNG